MAVGFYTGLETYVVFAEDTAFGTAGTPTGADYVDKLSSFSYTITNNMNRSHGIGEGRNATVATNGVLNCTGAMEWELTDPDFLQYCFVANRSGAGTAGDPYELQEVNAVGYAAGEMNTLTLEAGSNAGSNDDEITFDGVVINNCTITANVGDTVKASADWTGRTGTSSSTILTYTAPANRPFTFVDGAVTVGSDTVGALTNITLTVANNMFVYHAIGSRLIVQPVAGIRRYDFTLTMKLHFNDTASVLSGLEARGIVFSGLPAATTPLDGAQNTGVALSLNLVEGAASNDRVVNFDFENAYFESYSNPIELENGVTEITINGFALAGLSDGAVKVPCRWWTIT